MTDETENPPQKEPEPKRTARRKSSPGAQAVALGHYLVAKPIAGIAAFFGWLGRVLASPLAKIALLILAIYVFAPVDRLKQSVESWIDDQPGWFDQSHEGLIVVDTPQLFTRERLINERLEESAWIEAQLRNVDTLLEEKRFAQVDSISVTQNLLSIIGREGGSGIPGTDFEKLGELAEKLGTNEPSPLDQFRDAKNYRERLNLQRYDSILDDAHDIGANTLHRMNFRLTLSPARPRSDSVAAVSISVREPRGSRILFDHYGRLMVETRKKMEETVENLLRDRMVILNPGLKSPFQFQTRELELIDYLLKWKVIEEGLVPGDWTRDRDAVDAAAERYVEDLVNRVLEQQRLDDETKARAYLQSLITALGIPSLAQRLLPNYPEGNPTYWNPDGALTMTTPDGLEFTYALDAPLRMIEVCGRPFKLTDLVPEQFSMNGAIYQEALRVHVETRLYPQGRPSMPDPASLSPEDRAMLEQQRASEAEGRRALSQGFADALSQEFTYSCPNRANHITIAKLRLLGRLDILDRTGRAPFARCAPGSETRERLVAFIGMEQPDAETENALRESLARECPGSDLLDASLHLADRLRLTGGEYAQVGIVHLMEAKLTNLPLDSSARTLTLGQFFDFDVARCDLKSCTLRTRTKAEAMADRAGVERMVSRWMPQDGAQQNDKDLLEERVSLSPPPRLMVDVEKAALLSSPSAMQIAETGREEALRLFLELRCFADARSYTVWPRSGERLASYERESVQSGAHVDFGSLVKGLLGLEANSAADTIMRQERDHIFGIGDWGGNRERDDATGEEDTGSRLVPCSRELEAVLDAYVPNGTFITEFVDRLDAGRAPPAVLEWWQHVKDALNDPEADYCDRQPCRPSLETLMRIAQDVEEANTSTKFSWIIAPRRESPLRATRHVPMSVPLSALISLPSWWGHAELDITTCWVRPKDLKSRIPDGNLCDEETGTKHTLTVPLPGKAQDVLQRIGFFIIRTPYLETSLGQEEEVEAGRSARIRLTGSRLWKNPKVRIGNQWHDRIEVLPNMQGVIATFECIHPAIKPGKLTIRLQYEDLPRFGAAGGQAAPPSADCEPVQQGGPPQERGYGGQGQPPPAQCGTNPPDALYLDERQAEVWTSEGRTQPTVVKVHAFRPRYFRNGEMEQPCWLKDDTRTGEATLNLSDGSNQPLPDQITKAAEVGPDMPSDDDG